MTGTVFHGDTYTHQPVGTLLQVAGKPEIYLVTAKDQVLHIPDWTTFVAHRFFYDSSKPTQRVVTITQSALDCYRNIQGNLPWQQSKLMTCSGSNLYALFRDDTRAIKRRIPFAQTSDRYAPLVKSWGFRTNELVAGTTSECAAATGTDLKMRPGAVVELASDNDFYVITTDAYASDDVGAPAPATSAYRLNRFVSGDPFMPILYGTYGVVLQIPDGSLPDFVTNAQSGPVYDQLSAWACPTANCSQPNSCPTGGGGSSGAGSPTCTLGQRSCSGTNDFVVCEADPFTGAPTWHKWPCGTGWECVSSNGMCTQKVSTCTSGQRVCLSNSQFADCQTDAATGTNYWHPWLCGAGMECVNSNGQCSPIPYTGDPPHTIRCDNHAYTYTMHVTGPIKNGLVSSVTGSKVYLEYGSDSDGWANYVPSLSSKPYSLWVADTDSSGYPISHDLVMRGDVDHINLDLYSPDSGQTGWFNLTNSTWNVTGDCWKEGTSIRHNPLTPPTGTITCTQTGAVMKYAFDGPMQMLLAGGSVSGPTEIQYGSNSDGWTVPSSGKIVSPWNGSYHHEISLPVSVNGLNFYLNGAGGGKWFDLLDSDYDGDKWTAAGACTITGGLVTHADVAPSKTIDCKVNGPIMTVNVVGDVTSGIFGAAPSVNPTYLEYGSDTDGWSAYTADKPMATWSPGTQLYPLQMSSSVQNLNFFLYAPSTGSQPNNWFDLSKWTVTGDCWKDGGGIKHTPPPTSYGTLTCTYDPASGITVNMNGDFQGLLANGIVANPTKVLYGSDTDGWTVPYSSGKPFSTWNGTGSQTLLLPPNTYNFNMFLTDGVGGKWFDLIDSDGDHDKWSVGGDCWNNNGVITHSTPPKGTINCVKSGAQLTVTVSGQVAYGINGFPPTASPVYLEYGSDTDGWGAYTTGKPKATWTSATANYSLVLSSNVQNMNLFLYAPSTGSQPNNWFDLNRWNITGVCYRSGGGILHN